MNHMAHGEKREVRLKRLRLRSWRRGIRETDLILGGFADSGLAALDDAALDAYEALMEENDWDIYYWVTGARAVPPAHRAMIETLRSHARPDRESPS
jgi:antitoxin CptB